MAGVGFIGLGQMGGAMASHLVDTDGGLVVCDVRPEAADALVEAGATFTSSVSEVAAVSSVISVMVLDDDQVRSVVGEILPAAAPGTVVAIHSTIRPETAVELAEAAAASGIDVVDAPVSGGFMGAGAGTLAVLVGGTAEAVEKCRPVFDGWAEMIVHFGPVGAGTKAKLARNLMHFTAFTAALEASRLAEAAGIDLQKLGQLVRYTDTVTGGPGAIMVRDTTAPIPDGDFFLDIMRHTRTLGEKDLSLALEFGREVGVELPLGEVALQWFARGLGVPHDEEVSS